MNPDWPFDKHTSCDDVLSAVDLSGRVIIVTGANSGIGFETARSLAAAGATVVMACRNLERGNTARAKIISAHPFGEILCRKLDLASLSSVRSFCDALPYQRISTIICNAGTLAPVDVKTEDGFESTVGVSHIGHFFLVQQLLPRLLACEASRVVMVSSESHRSPATLDMQSLPFGSK